MTLGNFANSAYSPLTPFLKSHYLLNSAQLGLITSFIFIGSLSVSSLTGFFVDRLGSRTALKIAFAIISVGSLLAAASRSFPELVAGFYMIGFGYGIVTPSTNSAVMGSYYPNHARIMGIKQSGVPLGAALAAISLPLLALHFSLQVALIIVAVVSIAVSASVHRDKHPGREKNIRSGYFLEFARTWANRTLISVSLPVAFLSWGQASLLTFYVVYDRSMGIQLEIAEILLATLLVGSVFGRIVWISLSERMFSQSRSHMISLLMSLSGVLFLVFSVSHGNLLILAPLTFFIGMSAIGWNSTYVTMVSEIAPRERIGLFSGVSLMMISMGTILGTPTSGILVDNFSYVLMWRVIGGALLIMSLIMILIARSLGKGKASG
ncbi:MAG: MFS transporter [Candidatus Thermoplasmatota archaeon]|nr:MFS transporter [Candidatus Thermoplasmatota archaeon]